jgi:glutathione S-transferase
VIFIVTQVFYFNNKSLQSGINFIFSTVSPPCNAVKMVAKAINLDLNIKLIDTFAGENLTPEFTKINPQRFVPVLVDNGFILTESRAILGYLVDKYGKDDSLYPKDAKKRAIVNQRLFFDMGTLYEGLSDYFYPQMVEKQPADPEKFKKMEKALEFFDGYLAENIFAAGEEITIADYSMIVGFSTYTSGGYDFSRFTNVTRWFELCNKSLPGIEINHEGIKAIKELLKTL